MKWILLIFLLIFGTLQAESVSDHETNYLNDKNLWITTYKNQRDHAILQAKIAELSAKIAKRERRGEDTKIDSDELQFLEARLLASETTTRSFVDLANVPLPDIQSFELNFIKFLTKSEERELKRAKNLLRTLRMEYIDAISYLDVQEQLAIEQIENNGSAEAKKFYKTIEDDRHYFTLAKGLLDQKEESIASLSSLLESKMQHYRDYEFVDLIYNIIISIGAFVVLYLAHFFFSKISDNEERVAFWRRLSNLLVVIFVVLFFLFNYIDNVIYTLTLIGFMMAGLTIVHKEVLLNIAAWMHMAFSSSIQVGDRILLYYDATPIIGDVIAITPMKLTLYEEITHNNAAELKRAGRVIFIPTNYIFSKVIYNYTHETMKTIYDLIEIPLDIKSDFDLVEKIAEETVAKMTARYIEMARFQYERLRTRYELRGKDMGPRIQFMMKDDGKAIVMYLWYVAPYREILSCRSTLTLELIRRFKLEEKIVLLSAEK
ncbi:membrane protein [Campylobacterota bacterium]|nr:membrane protein [Campylobacterota bacterium]